MRESQIFFHGIEICGLHCCLKLHYCESYSVNVDGWTLSCRILGSLCHCVAKIILPVQKLHDQTTNVFIILQFQIAEIH